MVDSGGSCGANIEVMIGLTIASRKSRNIKLATAVFNASMVIGSLNHGTGGST